MGTTRVRFFEITHDGDARDVVAALADFMQKTFGSTTPPAPAIPAPPKVRQIADAPESPVEHKPAQTIARTRGRSQGNGHAENLLTWSKARGSAFSIRDASSSLAISAFLVGNAVDHLVEQGSLEVARTRSGQLPALFRPSEPKGQAQSSAGFPASPSIGVAVGPAVGR